MVLIPQVEPPLNRYSWWRYAMLLIVIVGATIYALPNLYDSDPSVQISRLQGNAIGNSALRRVETMLKNANLQVKSISLEDDRLLVRTHGLEEQLQVQQLLKENFGAGYVVALSLSAATPEWLQSLSADPMYLGLDLRGGVYFLMEVDVESALKTSVSRRADEVRSILRGRSLLYRNIVIEGNRIRVQYREGVNVDEVLDALEEEFIENDFLSKPEDSEVVIIFTDQMVRDMQQFAVKQNIITLRNRINELGVAEPVVQQQGKGRIVVQLPGIQDTARAKNILGATATLEYRMMSQDSNASQYARRGYSPPGTRLFYTRNGEPVLLENQIIVTGENIVNAQSGFDTQGGSPMVTVTLDSVGGNRMLSTTKKNVGNQMAVVFIETKTQYAKLGGKSVKKRVKTEKVINIAVIREQFANRFQTTGLDNSEEARDLSLLLRAGSLAAPIDIVEERTIGPSLGKDNIDQGFLSVIVGFILVLILMAVRYKLFGIIADVALTLNLILIVSLLSLMQATLTLPGIAGILLTVGMAVDANVLIFERIREELKKGVGVQNAIDLGYGRAFVTIADANITTLIAAIVLFGFGTGPIKGFAITLAFGIVTSMLTAIVGTRAVVNLVYGGKKVEKLSL